MDPEKGQETPENGAVDNAAEEAAVEEVETDTAADEEGGEEKKTASFDELKDAFYELAEGGSHMKKFTAPGSGREYVLTPLNLWTPRQNKAVRDIYRKAEESVRQGGDAAEDDGDAKVALGRILQALMEADLWCDAFSVIYLPVDSSRYTKEEADEYKDDFMDLTNEQALGALAFFIASSASSIPSGILGFFRETPMAKAIEDWRTRAGGSDNATST